MNNRTAKLIRKVARLTQGHVDRKDYQTNKRNWYSTPKPERHGVRTYMTGLLVKP